MEKRMLGKTGMMVSVVTYGGIVSTDDAYNGANPADGGQEASDRCVEYAIRKGVNYFDVAPTYGNAQLRLGNSLVPHRKNIHLACKTAVRDAEGSRRELEESLRLLHTDHFDVYQLHCLKTVEEVDAAFGKGGVMETLFRAKEEGVAKHLGVTAHSEDAALRALELYAFDTVLFPTNWGLHLGKGIGTRLMQAKKEKNFGFLGMKSLIHRAWNNAEERYASPTPKSWCRPVEGDDAFAVAAMKYALGMDIDTLVPPGTESSFVFAVEHIDECLRHPLSAAETELLRGKLPELEGRYFMDENAISTNV